MVDKIFLILNDKKTIFKLQQQQKQQNKQQQP
jgi:hypothetical protein